MALSIFYCTGCIDETERTHNSVRSRQDSHTSVSYACISICKIVRGKYTHTKMFGAFRKRPYHPVPSPYSTDRDTCGSDHLRPLKDNSPLTCSEYALNLSIQSERDENTATHTEPVWASSLHKHPPLPERTYLCHFSFFNLYSSFDSFSPIPELR